MEALGFSIYSIVLSTNSDNFPTSFPVWMSFISFSFLLFFFLISFSCLIVVARTDNTMLNRSDQSGYVCLHDFREKALSFSSLSVM